MNKKTNEDIDKLIKDGGVEFSPAVEKFIPPKYRLYVMGAELVYKLIRKLWKKKNKGE